MAKRIWFITDGHSSIEEEAPKLAAALTRAQIRLDIVLLADLEISADPSFPTLCAATKGHCIAPKTEEEAIAFVSQDCFVDLRLRWPLPAAAVSWSYIRNSILSVPLLCVELEPVPLTLTVVNEIRPIMNFRNARIMREMRLCEYPVFSIRACDEWLALVPTSIGQGQMWWMIRMTFPSDYPFVPPVIVLISRPPEKLKSVSESGRFIDKEMEKHTPRTHVHPMLKRVQNVLSKEHFWNENYVELAADLNCVRWRRLPLHSQMDLAILAIIIGEERKSLEREPKKKHLLGGFSQVSGKFGVGEPVKVGKYGEVWVTPDEAEWFQSLQEE
jgi:hypothetical protein